MQKNILSHCVLCVLALLTALWACCLTRAESLYKENTFHALISDNKARRVGDILTVQVFENSSATSQADTDTRRKNGLSVDLGQYDGNHTRNSLALGGNFEGGGKTQRSNRLLATLTVSIKEVLDNGDFLVSGEQQLTINQEQQKVMLEGRVRPVDISDSNVVLSTRLADAKITYMGDGDISDRNKRSWWRTLLDWIGL